MKVLLILCLLGLGGCAQPVLMVCSEKTPPSMVLCEEHVDGDFYKCKKSDQIRRCELAQ